MIFDANLLLSGAIAAANLALSGQAANGAGSVLSTNTFDVGPLPLGGNQATDLGAGERVHVVFTVLTAPTVGTSVDFQLIQADDAALTTNVQVIGSSGPIAIANLPAGTLVTVAAGTGLPPKRYVGARYVNVGAIATFSVFAAVTKDVQLMKNLYYKSGFAVT